MLKNYPAYEYYLAVAQLALAMLGMGATLQIGDFRKLARAPHGIALSLAAQWLLSPLLALALARLMGLPSGIAVGMLIVAAMPSGALSNVFTHLAGGNRALSIATTAVATLACLIATPLILKSLAASELPADFQMPAGRIVFEIGGCLLLPLLAGMGVQRISSSFSVGFSKACLRGSLVVLAMIVIGALGSGRLKILSFGWPTPLALLMFAWISYRLVLLVSRALKLPPADAAAASLTVLLRNCNLAVLLKASLFPATGASDALAQGVLFSALFYGGASLVLALVAMPLLRRAARKEAALSAGQPEAAPALAPPPRPRSRASQKID